MKLRIIASYLMLCLTLVFASNSNATLIGPDSNLDVSLSTTDLGGGMYQYDLNFTNTDTDPIWHFIVYTTDTTSNHSGSFPNVESTNLDMASVFAGYDATNIDPNINYLFNEWYAPFNTDGLAVGSSATMSFTANYHATSFLYAYEMVGTYVGGGSNEVSGIGYATAGVPEPGSLALLGLGLLGVTFARRAKRG